MSRTDTKVVSNDGRAVVESEVKPLSETLTRGMFVAYNGTVEDGERARGVVLSVDDDAGSVVVLTGVDDVTVSGDDTKTITVLAKSPDGFAQRVTTKARALGREYSWCEVANDAVKELNNTPELDENGTRRSFFVTVVSSRTVEVLPTREGRQRQATNGWTDAQLIENSWHITSQYDEPLYASLRLQNMYDRAVELTIIDPPTSEDDADDADFSGA
jgi:hypothetical protein